MSNINLINPFSNINPTNPFLQRKFFHLQKHKIAQLHIFAGQFYYLGEILLGKSFHRCINWDISFLEGKMTGREFGDFSQVFWGGEEKMVQSSLLVIFFFGFEGIVFLLWISVTTSFDDNMLLYEYNIENTIWFKKFRQYPPECQR